MQIPLHYETIGLPESCNTTMCFISCHLPSDAKGVSKFEKRNQTSL